MADNSSIHEFKVSSINGGTIDFSEFKGKKLLVVNTASDCEYTTQYKQLQELYANYQDKLVVVGFPSNNFGGQEPGSDKEIKNFCEYRYGVTFPLASKSDVIGKNMNEVFQWLSKQELTLGLNKIITWNFQKFLLDENGKLIAVYPPETDPINEDIIGLLEPN